MLPAAKLMWKTIWKEKGIDDSIIRLSTVAYLIISVNKNKGKEKHRPFPCGTLSPKTILFLSVITIIISDYILKSSSLN